MLVGRRVSKLRTAHGESLREAAVRTGVSHTTIARIEKGEVTGSFHSTLRKIAEGYGVKMDFLLTGRDPRQDFEHSIRRLPPDERSRLHFLSARTRTKMVLDFLITEYPNEFSVERLARAMGFEAASFQSLLDGWTRSDVPDQANMKIAETLSRLTGISPFWFRWGSLSEEGELLPPESMGAYVALMKKAAQAGIKPEMLEIAIDLLIMKSSPTKDNRLQQ